LRDNTIDIARGMGIILVVLCHNWILYFNRGELSNIVFSFHMPLFFFISGFFFKPNQSIKELLVSKSDGLLKPYFVVLFTVYFFNLIKNSTTDHLNELIGIFYGSGGTIVWTPLWFLSHLFIVFIFSWVFYRYILFKVDKLLYQLLILIFVLYVGASNITLFANNTISDIFYKDDRNLINGLPFNIDIIFITMPIFLSGFLLSKYFNNFQFKPKIIWVAFPLFVGLHYFFNETLELNGRDYDEFVICTIQMCAGIYITFTFAYLINKYSPSLKKILAYLGKASLFVFIFHFAAQHYTTGVLHYYYPDYKFLGAIIGMVISILYSVILWEIALRSHFVGSLMLSRRVSNAAIS
jgi:polysaccharide biosynthesis protein PslL